MGFNTLFRDFNSDSYRKRFDTFSILDKDFFTHNFQYAQFLLWEAPLLRFWFDFRFTRKIRSAYFQRFDRKIQLFCVDNVCLLSFVLWFNPCYKSVIVHKRRIKTLLKKLWKKFTRRSKSKTHKENE